MAQITGIDIEYGGQSAIDAAIAQSKRIRAQKDREAQTLLMTGYNPSTNSYSSNTDLTSSLFGGNAGGSFLDIAKTLAQQKADLAKAERGDISGYRAKEMAQQAGYKLGEIKESGAIQKGLEELRQTAMTGRTDKEIQGRQTLAQMNQDFQQATLERNRAAALSAGRAGSMFY